MAWEGGIEFLANCLLQYSMFMITIGRYRLVWARILHLNYYFLIVELFFEKGAVVQFLGMRGNSYSSVAKV